MRIRWNHLRQAGGGLQSVFTGRVARTSLVFVLIAAPWLCKADDRGDDDQEHGGLGKLVVIGDSLSAGFQNGTFLACQQVHGYASLIANQAHTTLTLPLIGFPGVPPIPGTSGIGFRLNPMQQPTNLAVPGQTVGQALTMVPNFGAPGFPYFFGPPPQGIQTMTNLVLGFPAAFAQPPVAASQVDTAIALNPDTVIVWLGSNDAIGFIEQVQNPPPTDPGVFANNLFMVLNNLRMHGVQRIVLANIPDATLTPFLRSNLSPPQQAGIRALIGAYNQAIAALGAAFQIPVVDIFQLVNRLAANGIRVDGRLLTTQAGGGLFSTDGIHPSYTGYALIANEFIKTMNERLDTEIRAVNISEVAAHDPNLPGRHVPFCTAP